MVELQHRSPAPPELTAFNATHPTAEITMFDHISFSAAKKAVKSALKTDQGGLCAYCEKDMASTAVKDSQVDHIKPKGGPYAHPHLCFTYTNYAFGCINNKTCGQKKDYDRLPIEPAPGCNDSWEISTDGTVQPILKLTPNRRHDVVQTRDILGLNNDSDLVDEREKVLRIALVLLHNPSQLQQFVQSQPYRHLLKRTLNRVPNVMIP
jgi:uncharacterized protein (TIGR02646 family)